MDDRPSDLREPASRTTRPPPARVAPPVAPRPLWRRLLWPIIGIVALGLIAWIIFRPHPQPVRYSRFALNGAMPIVAAAATKGDMPVTFNALGTVTPLVTDTVVTQINGQLTQVAFKEGQEVKKGDFLAQVDPRPYQAALDQLQGQLAKDQALLAGAKIDLARYQKLAKQNSIAQQQADDQLYLVRQYQGTVESDQAQVDNAKLNLEYCHIVAPATGRIGLRLVDPGNYVQTSNTTGIAVITQMKPISVIFTLPEDYLPDVQKRLAAGATLQVTAFDRSGQHKLATGTLETLDNQVDPTTGTIKYRAIFANDDEALFPNQFVNIQLLVDTLKNATVISTAAVQRGAPGTFVYVVKPDDTVTVQKVTLGPSSSEEVAVTAGLQPGQQVVIDGADKLREGAKVRIVAPNSTASAGSAAAAHQPHKPQQSANEPGQPQQRQPSGQ